MTQKIYLAFSVRPASGPSQALRTNSSRSASVVSSPISIVSDAWASRNQVASFSSGNGHSHVDWCSSISTYFQTEK